MKIIKSTQDYWQKYKDLRIESLINSPQSFLETPEEAEKQSEKDWQKRVKNMLFAIDKSDNLLGMIGYFSQDKEKLNHILNIVSFYVKTEHRKKELVKSFLIQL